MKRGLLIAGGALGGLGAVMAITPPQFSSNESLALGGGAMGGSSPTAVATAADSATPVATKTTETKKAPATASNSASTAVAANPAPASKGVSGTFVGPSVNAN